MALDAWPAWCKHPLGHYVKTLGDVGSKPTETEASARGCEGDASLRHKNVEYVDVYPPHSSPYCIIDSWGMFGQLAFIMHL